jgi:hypothetical protein
MRASAHRELALVRVAIRNGDYPAARRLIADIRSLGMSSDELEALDREIANLPEHERPVLANAKDYLERGPGYLWVLELDRAFDTSLESMNRSEFLSFAGDALTGRLSPKRETAVGSYFFQVADSFGIDSGEIEKLATDCIQARVPRLFGKDPREIPFDDWDPVGQAVGRLGRLMTPSALELVATLLVDHARRLKTDSSVVWSSDRFLPQSLVGTAIETLSARSYSELPEQVRYSVLIPLVKEARELLHEMAQSGNVEAQDRLAEINQRVFSKLV